MLNLLKGLLKPGIIPSLPRFVQQLLRLVILLALDCRQHVHNRDVAAVQLTVPLGFKDRLTVVVQLQSFFSARRLKIAGAEIQPIDRLDRGARQSLFRDSLQ